MSTNNTSPAPATDAVVEERPAWLPEKFENVEQMVSAYTELEKQQSVVPDHATDAATTGDGVASQEVAENDVEAAAALQAVGLDFNAYNEEFMSAGELSVRSYAELAARGISPDTVNSYIAGQQALAAALRHDVFSVVGGEEQYLDMTGWASANMSPRDITSFNAVMESGDTATMRLAVEGLKARFEAANGSKPSVRLGGGSFRGGFSGDAFGSSSELVKAMSDERYAKDATYREEVIAKLGRSNIM